MSVYVMFSYVLLSLLTSHLLAVCPAVLGQLATPLAALSSGQPSDPRAVYGQLA